MGQRLLLVDSDRGFLKEHRISLDAAFDLELAGPLEGVVPRLESGMFSAALICAEVGDNKGYALCSAIRKNPKLDSVKIALISAKASEEEYRRHQGLKGRADLYLHKPIAPSALVGALAPLVPSRSLDPDSPLGELVDTDLGDDWLDGLKSALEGPEATRASTPVFGVRPSLPTAASRPGTAVDATRLRALEAQVQTLQETLLAKEQQLLSAEAEVQEYNRQMSSTTVNLEELERGNREADGLKVRLAEAEEALRGLEASGQRDEERAQALAVQLAEAQAQRAESDQQGESLRQQLGEEARRVKELLEERDSLMVRTRELEPYRDKAQALETQVSARQEDVEALAIARQQELAGKQEELNALLSGRDQALAEKQEELDAILVARDQALAEKQEELDALLSGRDQALAEKQEELDAILVARDLALAVKQEEFDAILVAREQVLAAKQEELDTLLVAQERALAATQEEREADRLAQDQLNQTLEVLVTQHASLEALHQATLQEVAGQKERVHASQLELAGLEATMRGQGRDLAELGIQLREREAEREASQLQVQERDQQLLEKEQQAQQHRAEVVALTDQVAAMNQELLDVRVQHDGEQIELMNALDLKDAEMLGLHQLLAEKEAAQGALEREKQAGQTQLSEQQERLQNLDRLLQEIQDQLRRAADLARS